jgi:hypothetical protein
MLTLYITTRIQLQNCLIGNTTVSTDLPIRTIVRTGDNLLQLVQG